MGVGAVLAVLVAVVGGTGWLWVLKQAGLLGAGPTVDAALPLQQLAGDAGQPLARLVAAWLPAGLLAGLALLWLTRLTAVPRAVTVGLVAAITLAVAGAASDALTTNETIGMHIASQLHHAAPWVEAAIMAIGSLLTGRR